MKLFRPSGYLELALVYRSGMRSWPPRLEGQPIFYPVLNLWYAEQIAQQWNATSDTYSGYATSFDLDDEYASNFEPHIVGGSQHQEFWVPAEELANFNRHITSPIVVESSFFGRSYQGPISTFGIFSGQPAAKQLELLVGLYGRRELDLGLLLREAHEEVFLNYPYWMCLATERSAEDSMAYLRVLRDILHAWQGRFTSARLPTTATMVGR